MTQTMNQSNYSTTNPYGAVVPAAYNAHQALNQYNLQKKQHTDYLGNLKGDVLLGGGLNAAIAGFSKMPINTNSMRFSEKALARSRFIGTNLASGALAAVPQSFVNSATSEMSNSLANYYAKKDKKPSLLHAGLIAAPAIGGGVYSLGAIMHSMDKGSDLFKAKSLKEAGKHMLSAMNPVAHVKRGIGETKTAFKDLFSLGKVGFGKRGLAALNILGLGIGAAIPLYNYFKRNKEEQQRKRSALMQTLPYTDDIVNALGAGGSQRLIKKASLQKEALYVPVLSPLVRAGKHAKKLSELSAAMKEGVEVNDSLHNHIKEVHKNLANAAYDVGGLALLGGAGYLGYKKYKQSTNPYFYQQ